MPLSLFTWLPSQCRPPPTSKFLWLDLPPPPNFSQTSSLQSPYNPHIPSLPSTQFTSSIFLKPKKPISQVKDSQFPSTVSFFQFPDMIQQLVTLLAQQAGTGCWPRPHPQVFSTAPLTTLASGGEHIPRGSPALLAYRYATPSQASSDSEPSTSLTL